MIRLIIAASLLLLAPSAFAYIGPGAGIPVLGSLIGVLLTIVLAIGAIVLWPIRRLMKRRKAKANLADDKSGQNDEKTN